MGKPVTISGQGSRLILAVSIICSSIIGLSAASPSKKCDMSKCKGPLKFYEEINCKPVKKEPGDCCPYRFDCPHLSVSRASDKCYVNRNVYSVGEELKDEDRASPCDMQCTCTKRDESEPAQFTCPMTDLFDHGPIRPKDGCYLRSNFTVCSAPEEICPEKPEDRPKCEVDGKIYLDGQGFTPKDSPDLSCQCAEGYKGENVAPYCIRSRCGLEYHYYDDLRSYCAPVYYSNQNLQKSCFPGGSFRCQNDQDKMVASKGPASHPRKVPDEEKCKFGNMTLFIGEKLNMATDYSSVCVECTCDVPPVLTCVRQPDDKCDVTKHPPFRD